MPDQPSDTKKTAIKIAMGALLGGALGLTAARRNKQAVGSGQWAVGSSNEVGAVAPKVQPPSPLPNPHPAQRAPGVLSPDSPDWETLPAAHLPRPTYWPVVLAVSILFLAWGIVTTVAISVIGLLLLALALGGWIGELRHGH